MLYHLKDRVDIPCSWALSPSALLGIQNSLKTAKSSCWKWELYSDQGRTLRKLTKIQRCLEYSVFRDTGLWFRLPVEFSCVGPSPPLPADSRTLSRWSSFYPPASPGEFIPNLLLCLTLVLQSWLSLAFPLSEDTHPIFSGSTTSLQPNVPSLPQSGPCLAPVLLDSPSAPTFPSLSPCPSWQNCSQCPGCPQPLDSPQCHSPALLCPCPRPSLLLPMALPLFHGALQGCMGLFSLLLSFLSCHCFDRQIPCVVLPIFPLL